ncbi:MAG: hypothetical protein ACI85I_002397 [Arenicella sp.]|jgi:hypothetical protein
MLIQASTLESLTRLALLCVKMDINLGKIQKTLSSMNDDLHLEENTLSNLK